MALSDDFPYSDVLDAIKKIANLHNLPLQIGRILDVEALLICPLHSVLGKLLIDLARDKLKLTGDGLENLFHLL